MAITIEHIYMTSVDITYIDKNFNSHLRETTSGTMDDIAEHVCKRLIQHQFDSANVCSVRTGELLMIIERS